MSVVIIYNVTSNCQYTQRLLKCIVSLDRMIPFKVNYEFLVTFDFTPSNKFN